MIKTLIEIKQELEQDSLDKEQAARKAREARLTDAIKRALQTGVPGFTFQVPWGENALYYANLLNEAGYVHSLCNGIVDDIPCHFIYISLETQT